MVTGVRRTLLLLEMSLVVLATSLAVMRRLIIWQSRDFWKRGGLLVNDEKAGGKRLGPLIDRISADFHNEELASGSAIRKLAWDRHVV